MRIYPNELRGVVDDRLYKRLEEMYNLTYQLQEQVRHLQSQVNPKPDVTHVKRSLEAKGTHQLNVQGLIGKLAQPQLAGVVVFDSFPAPADSRSQDGVLGILSSTGALHRYESSSRSWVAIP